jgi:hypothetical protein
MRLEVFGKQRTNKDGKSFTTYLSRITNMKTGEIIPVQIKFRTGVEVPKELPIVANIEKKNANLVKENWENEKGETGVKHVLWVSVVTSYDEYIDHTLDDFE